MDNLTGNGRYAEIYIDNMNTSGIHSSFFNQSTYSDIRGTKGMQTEGTYLFLDFSQSNVSNKIHKDNFSRSNYADLKVPLMRRHSSLGRDTRTLSSYADLDFSRTLSKYRNEDQMKNNNNNKTLVIHGSYQQTVYSKIRPNSVEELYQSEADIYPKLYAKVVPKSQRNCNQQTGTGTNIKASKSTQDIYNSVSKNSSSNEANPRIKLELKPGKVPFRIRQINNTSDLSTNNQNCENRTKVPDFCSYNNLTPTMLVPVPKTQNRNPPPIRPKPLTGHIQAPPIPPHFPSNSIQPKNIPNSPIDNHDNTFARNSIHGSNECIASIEIVMTTPQFKRNSIGRSHSFRGPTRTPRPDKPPPPPPTKPTFHAFHHNNPIMSPKSTKDTVDSYDKLNVNIPSIRSRSQGESTMLEVRKNEEMTPPLPTRHNAKLNFQQLFNPTLKSLKKSHSIKPMVSMETDNNSYTLDYTNGRYDTKLTPTFPKRFLQLTNRPDLPPKPKPRINLSNENIICEGKIWKQNPKSNEWSQWYAVLDLFTLKLYQSKEDQPWLTIQTSKMKEINKFLLEGTESQIAFGLSTTLKTYLFTTNTNEQTNIWIKAITTTMS